MGPVSLQPVQAVQGLLLHRAEDNQSLFSNWLHEPCLGVSQRNVSAKVGQRLGLKLPLNVPKALGLGRLGANTGVVKKKSAHAIAATTWTISLKMTVVRLSQSLANLMHLADRLEGLW